MQARGLEMSAVGHFVGTRPGSQVDCILPPEVPRSEGTSYFIIQAMGNDKICS
jgi:hypothetical protein